MPSKAAKALTQMRTPSTCHAVHGAQSSGLGPAVSYAVEMRWALHSVVNEWNRCKNKHNVLKDNVLALHTPASAQWHGMARTRAMRAVSTALRVCFLLRSQWPSERWPCPSAPPASIGRQCLANRWPPSFSVVLRPGRWTLETQEVATKTSAELHPGHWTLTIQRVANTMPSALHPGNCTPVPLWFGLSSASRP